MNVNSKRITLETTKGRRNWNWKFEKKCDQTLSDISEYRKSDSRNLNEIKGKAINEHRPFDRITRRMKIGRKMNSWVS